MSTLMDLRQQLHSLARTVDTLVGVAEAQPSEEPERGGHSAARWDARRRALNRTPAAVMARLRKVYNAWLKGCRQ